MFTKKSAIFATQFKQRLAGFKLRYSFKKVVRQSVIPIQEFSKKYILTTCYAGEVSALCMSRSDRAFHAMQSLQYISIRIYVHAI